MIHLYGGMEETACCSTPISDLPKEDTLTFEDRKVTCGSLPLRHPEPLARWLWESLGGTWLELSVDDRQLHVDVAREALQILGFADDH